MKHVTSKAACYLLNAGAVDMFSSETSVIFIGLHGVMSHNSSWVSL
jgi:hypothetical protein